MRRVKGNTCSTSNRKKPCCVDSSKSWRWDYHLQSELKKVTKALPRTLSGLAVLGPGPYDRDQPAKKTSDLRSSPVEPVQPAVLAGGHTDAIAIVVAMIALIGTLGAAYINGLFTEKKHAATVKESSTLTISVFADSVDGPPISQADVDLGIASILPGQTDSRGRVIFRIDKQFLGHECRFTIRKEGYQSYSQIVILDGTVINSYPVSLKRVATPLTDSHASPVMKRKERKVQHSDP